MENSIEETIKIIERKTKEAERYSDITGLYLTLDEELRNALMNILSDYKRVLKENEELKKSKITYEKVRDIQEKNKNIVDNNYISKQIVKDNLTKYQEEYELLLEHQSGKESNKTKTLRERIHMCQELLESEE